MSFGTYRPGKGSARQLNRAGRRRREEAKQKAVGRSLLVAIRWGEREMTFGRQSLTLVGAPLNLNI